MKTKNIMIVGVGGQGSLLASKLLGRLLLTRGYDVKVSVVHGMSQRGGSVVTYVRFGEKVYSPVIDEGEADFIVSFELLEAARWTRWKRATASLTRPACTAMKKQWAAPSGKVPSRGRKFSSPARSGRFLLRWSFLVAARSRPYQAVRRKLLVRWGPMK